MSSSHTIFIFISLLLPKDVEDLPLRELDISIGEGAMGTGELCLYLSQLVDVTAGFGLKQFSEVKGTLAPWEGVPGQKVHKPRKNKNNGKAS